MSADIVAFPVKGSYERALREQHPAFQWSKGYPAVRDPAAERPASPLDAIGEGAVRKLQQRTSLAPTV